MRRMRFRLLPLASRLPDRVILWLERHVPVDVDRDNAPWNFWTDASYAKFMRNERRAYARGEHRA